MSSNLVAMALVLLSDKAEGAPTDDHYLDAIRPIFQQRCVACHGPSKQEGGLRLDALRHALQGGANGVALVAGDANQSLLVQRLESRETTYRMPPDGEALTPSEIANIRQWIDQGCKTGVVEPSEEPEAGVDPRLKHWAWQSIEVPPIPSSEGPIQPLNPIDAFVSARLAERGLQLAEEADRWTLARRLYVDLVGLPPTYEEVQRFVEDPQEDAYSRLVDQLLASPRYGERWAQHWLDVAHYGDTHGFERDQRRPNAWRYRDYVIRALNEDKPYDRFLLEQIAGDALEDADAETITATGFLAAGPWDFVGLAETPSPQIKRLARADDLDDMLTQVVTATCAVTINCARCHDHKIDPISQREYYALASVFGGAFRGDRPLNPQSATGDNPTPQASTGTEQIYAIQSQVPATMYRLLRGNPEQPGEPVSPAALSCLKGLSHELVGEDSSDPQRRLALARWIIDIRNPLTRRAIVNRVWHYHFGRGIVETPSDFGLASQPPSHPELLDWLADWIGTHGWSLKGLHRLICNSQTYRQSSRDRESDATAMDESNRWLWRQNVRRVEAEVLRDAILLASGALSQTMYGPGFEDFNYQEEYAPIYEYQFGDQPSHWRRTVYRFVVRTTPHPFLTPLDCPNPSRLTPSRTITTTAVQSLAMWNHSFILSQAERMATRVERQSGDVVAERIRWSFRYALARDPDPEEMEWGRVLLTRGTLHDLCRALLNANEFVYVD